MRKNLLIFVILLISCNNTPKETDNVHVYLKRTIQQLSWKDLGVYNTEINDSKYFFRRFLLYNSAGIDELITLELSSLQIDSLREILNRLDYSNSTQEFTGLVTGAQYEYYLHIEYGKKRVDVKIFDDSIPKQYIPLINYLESKKFSAKFDTIYSKFKGLNYSAIVQDKDSIYVAHYHLFELWKYLMLYKGEYEEISYFQKQKCSVYSLQYGLYYPEKKIDKIYLDKQNIYLTYNDSNILRIKKDSIFYKNIGL